MQQELDVSFSLDCQGMLKFKNHIKMMKSTGRKKEYLLRFEKTGLKIVVFDKIFKEVCYLAVLESQFFKNYSCSKETTLKIHNLPILYSIFKMAFSKAEQLEVRVGHEDRDSNKPILRFELRCNGFQFQTQLQCMIDEREFMDMSKIIEEKRRDKILLLTSQVNMLEILELFRESNLFIRFSRDQLELQGDNEYNSGVHRFKTKSFASYDFHSLKCILGKHSTTCYNSYVLSTFIKACNLVGVLMVYMYINTRVKDGQLKHYFIGDGLHELLYLSLNADVIDTQEDDISRITPYSKLGMPESSGFMKSIKLEEGHEMQYNANSYLSRFLVKVEEESHPERQHLIKVRERKSCKDPLVEASQRREEASMPTNSTETSMCNQTTVKLEEGVEMSHLSKRSIHTRKTGFAQPTKTLKTARDSLNSGKRSVPTKIEQSEQ